MNRDSALRALRRYVSRTAFVHDDHWRDIQGDIDELSAHPLFLDPPLLLTGKVCRDDPWFNEIAPDCTILEIAGDSPLDGLLQNKEALKLFLTEADRLALRISTFYFGDAESALQAAAAPYSSVGFDPDRARYSEWNDKLIFWDRMVGPWEVPIHILCESPAQALRAFYELGEDVYIKTTHSRTVRHRDPNEFLRHLLTTTYPILVEAALDVRSSPIAHYMCEDGEVLLLFVLRQHLVGAVHAGNDFDPDYESQIVSKYGDVLEACGSLFRDWTGVIGVDFVETSQGNLVPIDLNARFNSSTAPFAWLLGKEETHGVRFAQYRRHDVSALTRDLSENVLLQWKPDTLDGTLVFGGRLKGATEPPFFSLTVAPTAERLATASRELQLAIAEGIA